MFNFEKIKILAFGGRKRSGKTSLAKRLSETCGARVFAVAQSLKTLVCDLLTVDEDELDRLKCSGENLNTHPTRNWAVVISERCGIDEGSVWSLLRGSHISTVRDMLQVVGTDVIRRLRPDWHIESTLKRMRCCLEAGVLCIIDDMRFPNERLAIERLGGVPFFIIRPGLSDADISNHYSEIALTFESFPTNRVLINDDSIESMANLFCLTRDGLGFHFDENTSNPRLLSNRVDLIASLRDDLDFLRQKPNLSPLSVDLCRRFGGLDAVGD